jgi:hypothetical protein
MQGILDTLRKGGRERTRTILLLIIAATIPCYCLGLVTLWGSRLMIGPKEVTATPTMTVIFTPVLSPTPQPSPRPSLTHNEYLYPHSYPNTFHDVYSYHNENIYRGTSSYQYQDSHGNTGSTYVNKYDGTPTPTSTEILPTVVNITETATTEP